MHPSRILINEETRLIPIVMMTALNGFDDRIQGITARRRQPRDPGVGRAGPVEIYRVLGPSMI